MIKVESWGDKPEHLLGQETERGSPASGTMPMGDLEQLGSANPSIRFYKFSLSVVISSLATEIPVEISS